MNTCADCKHVLRIEIPSFPPVLWLCNAPQNEVEKDSVTGAQLYRAHRCTDQREVRIFSRSKYCGPSGNWYEPK